MRVLRPAAGFRLMFVHAHPDDETITNGATMACYAAAGAEITLITCTRGELGEVIGPGLAPLSSTDPDGDGSGDALGLHRMGELAAAMAVLGVTDHRLLDEIDDDCRSPGRVRYRDSGMAYAPDGRVVPAPDPPAGAFALADPEEVARRLATAIRKVRPHVLVTYDPNGGYGHPDHVQTHRVTMRAAELADPAWPVPKLYWVVGGPDQATAMVDATAQRAAKAAALRAHQTQVLVHADDAVFELSNGVPQELTGVELYRLVRSRPGLPPEPETDLLAGLSPSP